MEDLSVAEAAEILGRRVGAVRALQHRALKALAALVAAIVVWFARNPILDVLGFDREANDGRDEYDGDLER